MASGKNREWLQTEQATQRVNDLTPKNQPKEGDPMIFKNHLHGRQ
jgi:hypothetical protein